jgi:hypothetical protein
VIPLSDRPLDRPGASAARMAPRLRAAGRQPPALRRARSAGGAHRAEERLALLHRARRRDRLRRARPGHRRPGPARPGRRLPRGRRGPRDANRTTYPALNPTPRAGRGPLASRTARRPPGRPRGCPLRPSRHARASTPGRPAAPRSPTRLARITARRPLPSSAPLAPVTFTSLRCRLRPRGRGSRDARTPVRSHGLAAVMSHPLPRSRIHDTCHIAAGSLSHPPGPRPAHASHAPGARPGRCPRAWQPSRVRRWEGRGCSTDGPRSCCGAEVPTAREAARHTSTAASPDGRVM